MSEGRLVRRAPSMLALASLALLAVACAAVRVASDDEPSPAATASPTASATATASPPPPLDPTPTSTPAISEVDFCAQAELTAIDWDLPDVLTGSLQEGTITLRYRIPPGAEALLIALGVVIEPGSITIGQLLDARPGLASQFQNADRTAPIPAIRIADGFDLEIDGQTHVIEVGILLPSEQLYDGGEWAWSDFTDPPFAVGEPVVSARFRADGVRVDMDGVHCTPRIYPLP